MRIPMLHTPSVEGPVSSLVDESSATAQTEMHSNEAPKHTPCANVKSSQYINEKSNTGERPETMGKHSPLVYMHIH